MRTPHLNDLTSADLNALLDRYVFHQDRWCHGRVEFRFLIDRHVGRGVHRCSECGAELENAKPFRHVRLVPSYGVEQIIAQMDQADPTIRDLFVMEVYSLVHGMSSCRALLSTMRGILTAFATPRLVAIAALRALNVIGEQGYVVGSERGEAASA